MKFRNLPDKMVFRLELPGVKAENVSVSLKDNQLRIEGQQHDVFENEDASFEESTSRSFFRSFPLPLV